MQGATIQKTSGEAVDVHGRAGDRGGFDARDAIAGRLDETTVRQAAVVVDDE